MSWPARLDRHVAGQNILAARWIDRCPPSRVFAARSAVGMSRATGPNMMVEEVNALAQITEQLASNSGDFGGYTIPIIGLGTLAAIISLLAGPVAED